MEPSEVRAKVLRDHASLRQRIQEVARLAEDVIETGATLIGKLRQAATELLHDLTTHMSWEDRYLGPALDDADAWGPERLARFQAEHRQQREDLHKLLAALEDQRHPASLLAGRVLEWLNTLRDEMRDEESAFLDKQVLRDDVIGIDVETG